MASIVVAIVNLWKERPGDPQLIAHARAEAEHLARTHGATGVVLALTEKGRGSKSVRVRTIGLKAGPQRWRKVTPFGAHNHIAIRDLHHPRIRFATAHGLHKGSVGMARQLAYYALLTVRVRRWGSRRIPWAVAGDFNRPHQWVARLLGGTSVGKGIDGLVAGPGLEARLLHVAHHPATDHPILYALIR